MKKWQTANTKMYPPVEVKAEVKKFRILPEFVDEWTNSDNPEDWVVDLPEIQRLAAEWDLTVEELLDEVEEIEED